jgi:hypothetical protein
VRVEERDQRVFLRGGRIADGVGLAATAVAGSKGFRGDRATGPSGTAGATAPA